MKKLFKIFLITIALLIIIAIAAVAYLNFIYLPQKVKTEGAAYLEQKTKGQVRAESIQYIPFKGVKLKGITILSKTKEPLAAIDKLYLNVNLWPLFIRKELDFRLDLYPAKIKRPFIFKGLYRIKEKALDLDFKIRNNFFRQRQTIIGKLNASLNREKRRDIDLSLSSPDLNLQGNLYIKDKDLRIEKLSAEVLESSLKLIGDVQNLSNPYLNIYGNLDLNLADFKSLNPEYAKALNKLNMNGRCLGEIFISSGASNPQIGLKIKAGQIQIEKTRIKNLSIVSKMENKRVFLSKFYAKLYGGEANLQGVLDLNSKTYPITLNVNIFNLDLNKVIRDATGKETPLHGRFFTLARLSGPLKDPRAVEGQAWVSASGSNILQLPAFAGIADTLRLPELRRIEFKEASGNFSIAKQAIRTNDFKIVSNKAVIYFKGYMDFNGDLGFDIQPSFSENFLRTAPNVGNILGIFVDSTGRFLGEIKMKGNIKKPRYTFKPVVMDKLFPKGIEEGFKELFKKFKKKD